MQLIDILHLLIKSVFDRPSGERIQRSHLENEGAREGESKTGEMRWCTM
jgi:hypothetical protein